MLSDIIFIRRELADFLLVGLGSRGAEKLGARMTIDNVLAGSLAGVLLVHALLACA